MPASYRDNPPEDFQQLLNIWSKLKPDLLKQNKLGIEFIDDALLTGSWAWKPTLEARVPENIDRLGDVLLGPVFSSVEHPWPDDDGVPMIPMLQLDLDNASQIGGVELESGLLQVFVAPSDPLGKYVLCQVVPRADVSREALTPVPELDSSANGLASAKWADVSHAERVCYQIVDFAEKRFTYVGGSALISEWFGIGALEADQQELARKFDAISQAHSKDWSPSGFHLFGTFFPIQYRQEERSWPLFCLEPQLGFNFADGQAQVFIESTKSGDMYFSFEWSCY